MDRELSRTENQLRTERDNRCDWYINEQGQMFSVIEAGSFLMGSPESKDVRSPGESLHRRQISPRFAMATKKGAQSAMTCIRRNQTYFDRGSKRTEARRVHRTFSNGGDDLV